MSTTPEPLDLDAIRARADAATQGPWQHVDHGKDGSFMGCGQVITWGEGVEGGDIAAPSGACYPRSGYSPYEDMAFIAAARTDVPALLDEIERLHTWAGLMSVIDEQYPISVFPVQPDDNRDGDYGPRILSLLRRLDERRTELRDKGNDLLDVRGLLSPNGGDSVLPAGFDISEQVAPAVEWLINEVWRLRVVGEAAAAIVSFLRERGWTPANEWFMPETVPFVAAVEAWQQGGGS